MHLPSSCPTGGFCTHTNINFGCMKQGLCTCSHATYCACVLQLLMAVAGQATIWLTKSGHHSLSEASRIHLSAYTYVLLVVLGPKHWLTVLADRKSSISGRCRTHLAMIMEERAAFWAFPVSRGPSNPGMNLSFHTLKSLTVICLTNKGSASKLLSVLVRVCAH